MTDEKEKLIQKTAEETARDVEQGLTGVVPPDGQKGGHHHDHLRRTWGNKIFDLAVWPTLAFGAVYGLSTWAVKEAKAVGSAMNTRIYEPMASGLSKLMPNAEKEILKGTGKAASKFGTNMSLIAISFAVGTALMVPIKLLEDRRGKISRWIDEKLDTVPADPDHYLREPKQSWKSVLGGRMVTFLSVLGIGTAVGGDRTERIEKGAADFMKDQWKKHINQDVTTEGLKKVEEWTKANTFEIFYTSLCAGMVYVLSRVFARHLNREEEQQHNNPGAKPAVPTAPATEDDASRKPGNWAGKTSPRTAPQKSEGFVHTVDTSRVLAAQQPAI